MFYFAKDNEPTDANEPAKYLSSFEMPPKMKIVISYALLTYLFSLVTVVIVYLNILFNMIREIFRSEEDELDAIRSMRRSTMMSKQRESMRHSRYTASTAAHSDHIYSDGSSNLRKSSHRAGSVSQQQRAHGASADHSVIMQTLKKKPSKSILVTNRSSVNSNRVSVNSNVSSRNAESIYGEGSIEINNNTNISRESNLDIDFDRKSGTSIKSVSWNEKTQVRKMYQKPKRSTIAFDDDM
jgi:hypothetical protein